jgi:hypothetical protein
MTRSKFRSKFRFNTFRSPQVYLNYESEICSHVALGGSVWVWLVVAFLLDEKNPIPMAISIVVVLGISSAVTYPSSDMREVHLDIIVSIRPQQGCLCGVSLYWPIHTRRSNVTDRHSMADSRSKHQHVKLQAIRPACMYPIYSLYVASFDDVASKQIRWHYNGTLFQDARLSEPFAARSVTNFQYRPNLTRNNDSGISRKAPERASHGPKYGIIFGLLPRNASCCDYSNCDGIPFKVR